MNSVSQTVFEALLSKGYFPRELPAVFTTSDFGSNAGSILDEWERAELFKVRRSRDFGKVAGQRYRDKLGYKKVPKADPESISKPKKIYERRNIQITHPIPQALLVRELAENWKTIQKWLSRQTYSEDEILVSKHYDRGMKGINFQMHRAKNALIEATADWLVKTDITRFYPSIYTHSISWAAYGKERVKSNLNTYEGSLADRLDLLVRSCNRNQTVGIPIGPETSRILAEIISSRIDLDFSDCLSSNDALTKRLTTDSVDRLQDDWVVGTSSLEQAENTLSLITKCYREYGLEINGGKTSITHLMKSSEPSWKSEIGAFLSHRRGSLTGARLSEFFALCLRLQLEIPSDPVINYALSTIEGHRFRRSDLQAVETFLLKAAAVAPVSLDRVCRIVLNINHETGSLSKRRLAKRFTELAERNVENGSLYEVIWLLYTLRGLRQPFVAKRVVELSETMQSSALRLVLLDIDQLGLSVKRLPKQTWEAQISSDRALTDWSWLYAYEAVRKGWLSGPPGLLNSPFFKPMHDRNVVFYDPRRNVQRSDVVKRASNKIRKADNLEVARLVRLLRGIGHHTEFGSGY